jgi:histidinol dehydrogenase
VITLAETEGLPAHADSVRRRLAALGELDEGATT